MPYFLKEEDDKSVIKSMPGLKRFSISDLVKELKEIEDLGIKTIAIFPKVEEKKKDNYASESISNDNLVCRALREIKKEIP